MTKSSFSLATMAGAVLGLAVANGVRADSADLLTQACLAQLALTETVCDCIAERAKEALSETQQLYVIAELNGDEATSSQLESEMTDAQVFEVGDWMDNAPAICEFD